MKTNPAHDSLVDMGDEVILHLPPAKLKSWLRKNYKDLSGGSDLEGGWYVRLHQSSIKLTIEDYIKGDV